MARGSRDHARATLEALLRIWHRPVCVLTVVEGKPRMLRYDGSEHSDRAT
jgi:stage V sporulation protein R